MKSNMRKDADLIIHNAIEAALPDRAVKRALKIFEHEGGGKTVLVAIGKAAWQMANRACHELGDTISCGIVITKHGHSKGEIKGIEVMEAGHPLPDEGSYKATEKVIDLVSNLGSRDSVIFLVSGGGSSLFEKPLVPEEEMVKITEQLLESGADIKEINTIRKRLSAVKGGKFAKLCHPAKIFSIVLSDVLGDSLDMIASGPAYPDSTTCKDALNIVEKYNLKLSDKAMELLKVETPKEISNVETHITGSVKQLCFSAINTAEQLGYKPVFLTADLCCEAREAGVFLGNIAKTHSNDTESLAYICGGETVVHVKGTGLGGRNQELALAAADSLKGLDNVALFSVGSDGTDGPTDAAGGYVDGETSIKIEKSGKKAGDFLKNNDAYNGLKLADGLIKTGSTGTNVNDLTVLLIKR